MNSAIAALQQGASDFITKPINDDTLHLALNRAVQRYTSKKQLKDYTSLLETEKAETSQELLRILSFQKNLIESSMDGILGCDGNDRVVIFNESMEDILGFSREDVVGRMTFDAFFSHREDRHLKKALSKEGYGGSGRLFLYETTLVGASGRRVPVQVSAISLQGEQSEQGGQDGADKGGIVCFFRDLREIRKLEREMEDQARILHQDKMMALGKLAASMVHEINNPLTGILNYSRLMIRILSRGTLTENHREKFKRYLELVESETHRCSQIASSLLTFSRKSSPAFGKVDVGELIHRCGILSRHKIELGNIDFQIRIQPDLPHVNGDFNQLQQCVINLIFNAIDAMPTGGHLLLSGDFNTTRKMIAIEVKDTGDGIPEEDLPNIFEPFFTTKNEEYGVGLGLSTVYGIIERHGGKVHVKSDKGQGTVFTLEIPVI